MGLTAPCRTFQYKKFYRIKPKAAIISSLALECWYIGLAGSVLIARIGQFIFAACFWVGRIDSRFLSEDVNILGYAFDYVPVHFVKDLLVHEAHHHPYIERLSQMYLMKLRHGDKFATDAGNAWRQLFLLSIMPWIQRYRVHSSERQQTALKEANEGDEKEEDRPQVAQAVQEAGMAMKFEAKDVGHEIAGAGRDLAVDLGTAGKDLAKSVRHFVVDDKN